jgi:hypothetical protein
MHAGTAEPFRVTPPEAVAYLLRLIMIDQPSSGEPPPHSVAQLFLDRIDGIPIWRSHRAPTEPAQPQE